MKFCSQCGTKLMLEARFCAACGAAVMASPSPHASSAMPPPMPQSIFEPALAWAADTATYPTAGGAAAAFPSHTTPGADLTHIPPGIALWNPMVAVCVSYFLSTIFGAWIHARNWRALGEPTRAKTTMRWGVGVFLAEWLVSIFTPNTGNAFADLLIPFLLTAAALGCWYFFDAKDQVERIAQLPSGYEKKRWAKPVWIGIGLLLAYTVVYLFFYILGVRAGLLKNPFI